MARRPEIGHDCGHAWEAFLALNAARGGGWGPEPIRVSEIEAYCRVMAICDPDTREEVLLLVQAMDAEYLKWAGEKQKRRKD